MKDDTSSHRAPEASEIQLDERALRLANMEIYERYSGGVGFAYMPPIATPSIIKTAIAAYLSALAAGSPKDLSEAAQADSGAENVEWISVPREPTAAMINSAAEAIVREFAQSRWERTMEMAAELNPAPIFHAMVSAAGRPPRGKTG